eukprot:2340463-Rhodomonas_salina.1
MGLLWEGSGKESMHCQIDAMEPQSHFTSPCTGTAVAWTRRRRSSWPASLQAASSAPKSVARGRMKKKKHVPRTICAGWSCAGCAATCSRQHRELSTTRSRNEWVLALGFAVWAYGRGPAGDSEWGHVVPKHDGINLLAGAHTTLQCQVHISTVRVHAGRTGGVFQVSTAAASG